MNLIFGKQISTGILILVLVAVLAVVGGGAYALAHHNGFVAGGLSCQLAQADAQATVDKTAKTTNERIDHETPFTGSRDARFDWLLDNARIGQ